MEKKVRWCKFNTSFIFCGHFMCVEAGLHKKGEEYAKHLTLPK